MRRPALTLALALLIALALCAPSASASRAAWVSLSRELSAPWPGMQRADGTFPDWLRTDRTSRYGDAMLGLGLIQTGVRDRNRPLVRSGLRAVNAATRSVDEWFPTRVFEHWAVASAYNLASQKLRHWRSANAARRRWARWIRYQRLNYLNLRGYQNKTLVDAVAVLEAQRTGIHSRVRSSVVGGRRGFARRLAVRLINQRVPDMAHRVRGYVLSDPPNNPIAYHAFSYAMYARAVRLLGRSDSYRARRVLRQVGRTSSFVAAPDGSLAYWGRSQEQKWTLPATAYGLGVTAREQGSARPDDRAGFALADRVLNRLRNYGVGPHGEWVVPSIRQNYARGLRSIDDYARATEYTGLALVYLNWAIPFLPRGSSAGPIRADAPFSAVLNPGPGRFVTVRHGDLWYAVRLRGGGGYRYDFGPTLVKRLENAAWRDVIPYRPNALGSGGPVLVAGARRGLPIADSVKVLPDGVVSMTGGFADSSGYLRGGVQLRVRPVDCGVALEVDAKAGDVYSFSALFRGDVTPEVGPDFVRTSSQQVAFNLPIKSASADRDFVSVSDAFLTRERIVVDVPTDGPVTMRLC
jgi:hypothetical protein